MAKKLRDISTQAGLKQSELVRLSGQRQPVVSRWWNDKRPITLEGAISIYRHLGCNLLDLYDPPQELVDELAVAPLDTALLADVLQAVRERNLNLTPADEADLIATLYQMAKKASMPDAETIELLAKLASKRVG